jgi:hypothetical protein
MHYKEQITQGANMKQDQSVELNIIIDDLRNAYDKLYQEYLEYKELTEDLLEKYCQQKVSIRLLNNKPKEK